jgi:hypothetical protein
MDKSKLLSLIFVWMSSMICADLIQDLSQDRDHHYQDLLINGELVWKGGGPDCSSRYEALRPLLDSFNRPFKVLEIGANNGYFSLRMAQEYGATCVMVDGTDRLRKICELNSNMGQLVYLQKFLSVKDIGTLAKKEHFDVVICFHVLHHQRKHWKDFANAVMKLGDYVVIETPPANDVIASKFKEIPEIPPYLLSRPQAVQIGSFLRQTSPVYDYMILISNPSEGPAPESISQKTFKLLNGTFTNVPLRD